MAIQLGSLVLNPYLLWTDRYKFSPTKHEVVRTIGGRLVVKYGTLQSGRPITLQATDDQGWLSTAMMEELQIMANSPGGEFNLVLDSFTTRVLFRHQDAPALDLDPLISRITFEPTDYHVGYIKLFTKE